VTDGHLLVTLLDIANRASVLINAVYRTPFDVDYKGPLDPVTEADRQANELICRELQAHFPDAPVVAEESDPESFANFRSASRVFFVDPVDGTREFVQRIGEFVVMIGMLEDDRATVGVIQAPTLNTAWYGVLGQGAFRIDPDGTRQRMEPTRVDELSKARIVASRSHRSAKVEGALASLGARRVDALGSAGLKGLAVAAGQADAYVAPMGAGWLWDSCAIDAVVNAAGGRLTDAYGDLIDYRSQSLRNDCGLVASNGLLHQAILERLAQHRGQV
jgi:3'(2'), 5'-bisphosphate nucleotidase